MIRPTGRSTLFPYTTLFRSDLHRRNNIESIVSRERSVGDERRRTTAGGGVHRAKCAGKRRGSVNAVVIDVPYPARQATAPIHMIGSRPGKTVDAPGKTIERGVNAEIAQRIIALKGAKIEVERVLQQDDAGTVRGRIGRISLNQISVA